MASTGKLIVPIDGDLSGLQRSIRSAERTMKRSAAELGSIATNMSRSISLPFLALGVGAIKAAADFGQLRDGITSTMTDAGYSITAAKDELVKLKEIARAPGIDMEQAVKGSLRLQSVGFSAESARETLKQLANEITKTGGAAPQLDGVTKQLAQMRGKGKILQEDLMIISENMPSIAKHMQNAFGSSNAELIRKSGISVEAFIEGITKSMATTSRATGGLANDINNAMNAIKFGAAEVGTILNERLRIGPALAGFADWISGAADAFKDMSPAGQTAVIAIAAFAVALGPAIKVGSVMVNMIIGMSANFARLRLAMASVQAGGFVAWWQTLNTVVKANYIGIAVGVVLALAAAVAVFTSSASDATATTKAMMSANADAEKSIIKERIQVENLQKVLNSETASRQEKIEAMRELKNIAPDLFKQYDVENFKIKEVNQSITKYIDLIRKRAQITALNNKLVEEESKLYDLQTNNTENADFLAKTGAVVGTIFTLGQVGYDEQLLRIIKKNGEDLIPVTKSVIEGLTKQIETLEKDKDVKQTVIEKTKDLTTTTSGAASKSKLFSEAISDVRKEIEKANVLGIDGFEANVDAIQKGLDKVLDAGYSKDSPQVAKFVGMMKALKDSMKMDNVPQIATLALPQSVSSQETSGAPQIDTSGAESRKEYLSWSQQLGKINADLTAGQITLTQAFKSVGDVLGETTPIVAQSVQSIAESMIASSDLAIQKYSEMIALAKEGGISASENAKAVRAGFGVMAQSALQAASKVIRAHIQMMVTRAALSAMKSIPFPLNLAVAAGAGAAANALAGMLIARVSAPKLAAGGIAYGETMATVGEYAGASNNPEVIAPLNKLRNILGDTGTQNVNVSGSFKMSGADLYAIIERQQAREKRIR